MSRNDLDGKRAKGAVHLSVNRTRFVSKETLANPDARLGIRRGDKCYMFFGAAK